MILHWLKRHKMRREYLMFANAHRVTCECGKVWMS